MSSDVAMQSELAAMKAEFMKMLRLAAADPLTWLPAVVDAAMGFGRIEAKLESDPVGDLLARVAPVLGEHGAVQVTRGGDGYVIVRPDVWEAVMDGRPIPTIAGVAEKLADLAAVKPAGKARAKRDPLTGEWEIEEVAEVETTTVGRRIGF